MHDWGLHRAIADQGWIEQALPEALGGGGRGPEELAVLFRELELAGAPYDGLSICTMLASVIAHVGNDMQRQVVLPKLLAGESLIALGYSRARLRLRRRRRATRAPSATATGGASTARRSSPAWPRSRSGCSCSPAPTPRSPSTRD